MKATKAFKRNIMKICKEHNFDINRDGEMTVGQAEYDNGSGFMPLFVQRCNKHFIRIAHYYMQNGDAMADPEIFFYVDSLGDWYPQEFRQDGLGLRRELIAGEWVEDFKAWKPTKYNQYWQHDAARFCTAWGKNISWQQSGNSATIHYQDGYEGTGYIKRQTWLEIAFTEMLEKAA